MKPKVSVILPTYNGEEYLSDAVESILRQSLKDWELIIVDDCSTDRTYEIACTYQGQDERVHVVRNEKNLKLPGALNAGVSRAKAQYITWTSDDNIYLSNAFELMVSHLDNKEGCDLICTAMLLIDTNGKVIGESETYNSRKMNIFNMVGASFMYRRSVYERIGEYDEGAFGVEDYDYWLRILKNGGKIDYLRSFTYLYRVHENSLTYKKANLVCIQRGRLLYKYFDYIIGGLEQNELLLLKLYNDLILNLDISAEKVKALILPYLPLVAGDACLPDNDQIIIYGAGKEGEKAYRVLGKRAICFVDSNPKKQGIKDGIQVILPGKMIETLWGGGVHIVIAVGYEKQGEVIRFLREIGISSFSVMAHIQREACFIEKLS